MEREEHVMVIPRTVLWPAGEQNGFVDDIGPLLPRIEVGHQFMLRRDAEETPAFQQIIPYCVIFTDDGRNVYTTVRRVASTELRLHGKRSVGIGGHINPIDAKETSTGWDIIRNGLKREWAEELSCSHPVVAELVGVLNDTSAPVSMVHLGLVYRIMVDEACAISVKETEKLEGAFLPREQVLAHPATESWGRFALETLDLQHTVFDRVTIPATAGSTLLAP